MTNIDFEAWADYLGDAPLAMALLDRVVDGATIVKIEGQILPRAPRQAGRGGSVCGRVDSPGRGGISLRCAVPAADVSTRRPTPSFLLCAPSGRSCNRVSGTLRSAQATPLLAALAARVLLRPKIRVPLLCCRGVGKTTPPRCIPRVGPGGRNGMPGIRFDEIRAMISMREVLDLVGFVARETRGDQVRGGCPVHRSASAPVARSRQT